MRANHFLVLGGLLVLPTAALYCLPVDLWRLVAYVVVISALTYVAYARDKRRAQANEWRIAESQLHLMELLGGWPGAWLAQTWLRHKSSKRSYQVVFWGIVLIHQFAALETLLDWRITRAVVEMVTGAVKT